MRWIVDEDGSRFNAATNHPAVLRCKLVDIINLVVEELDEGCLRGNILSPEMIIALVFTSAILCMRTSDSSVQTSASRLLV